MNLSDLTKEQKKYLALGVIAAAALVILIAFGIKVSLSSIRSARSELSALNAKIGSAEKAVVKSRNQHEELNTSIETLKGYLANIPPDRNYYSWATEVIYNEARTVQCEIDVIDEMTVAAMEAESAVKDKVEMESYALRITARGSYESVKQLLRHLTENHPLLRVTGIEISTGISPEIHDVQLLIEWPFNMGYLAEPWSSTESEEALNDTQAGADDSIATPHPSQPRSRDAMPGTAEGPAGTNAPGAEKKQTADHCTTAADLESGCLA